MILRHWEGAMVSRQGDARPEVKVLQRGLNKVGAMLLVGPTSPAIRYTTTRRLGDG
jgi:hypothetical protein